MVRVARSGSVTPIPALLAELDALAARRPTPMAEARFIHAYPLLRAEILRLREALEPFAKAREASGSTLSVLDFDRARAALKGPEGGE